MRRIRRAAQFISVVVVVFAFGILAADCSPSPTASENELLRTAKQGEVLTLTNLWSARRKIQPLAVRVAPLPGPQLLFSDRPEYFRAGDGIALCEDVTPGRVRLYVYHVPEPKGGHKVISATLENCGTNDLHLRFTRRAFPPPSGHYLAVGKRGLMDYWSSTPDADVRTVAPGQRIIIDPEMDKTVVSAPELVHGFYEFEIDQPAQVKVFQRSTELNSLLAAGTLQVLDAEKGTNAMGAGRGRFLTNNFEVTGPVLDATNGSAHLIIADGKRDPWISGHDSIANAPSLDKGNYGVMYHIHLRYRTLPNQGWALLAYNPLGERTGCGQLAMAVKVNDGDFPGGIAPIPKDNVSFGGRAQMVLIQRFPPVSEGKEGIVDMEYSPPGASCLPTPFLLVPYTRQLASNRRRIIPSADNRRRFDSTERGSLTWVGRMQTQVRRR